MQWLRSPPTAISNHSRGVLFWRQTRETIAQHRLTTKELALESRPVFACTVHGAPTWLLEPVQQFACLCFALELRLRIEQGLQEISRLLVRPAAGERHGEVVTDLRYVG